MPFTRFTKINIKRKSVYPTIAIYKTGQVTFNRTARERFGIVKSGPKQYIALYYDEAMRRIGFTLAICHEENSVKVVWRNSTVYSSIKSLMNYLGITIVEPKRFLLESDGEYIYFDASEIWKRDNV